MRVLLAAAAALLLLAWFLLLTPAGDEGGSAPGTARATDAAPSHALPSEAPVLRGDGVTNRVRRAPTSRPTLVRTARDELAALAARAEADWQVQLGLIEGTGGLSARVLLAAIAADDALYLAWVGVFLSFDGPQVAAHDLESLAALRAVSRAYLEQPAADATLVETLREMQRRLSTKGAVHLPVELSDELLPRWLAALESRPDGATLEPPEADLFRDLAALVRDYHDGTRSRFPPLLELHVRTRARARADAGVPPRMANPHTEPWSRWRADLGRLLLVPSAAPNDDLFARVVASSSALGVAAGLPRRDLERVLLRETALGALTAGDGIARDEINRLAREHVERFLAFLALLEVETAYGRAGLFPHGPDSAAARLYLLTSALHARGRLPSGPGPGATWLTAIRDDGLEPHLTTRYPDLAQAREAAWEVLAGEIQDVVAATLAAGLAPVR
jgi:hypothetical protein